MLAKPEVVTPPTVHNETATPTIHNETAELTRPQAVPLQKEMLGSTTTENSSKMPDLTDCIDPLRPVQKYKAYFHVEYQRYKEGQRPMPPNFKATMSTTWIENYLMSGLQNKPSVEKWKYEEIDDEELFNMYMYRYKKKEPKRPSTF